MKIGKTSKEEFKTPLGVGVVEFQVKYGMPAGNARCSAAAGKNDRRVPIARHNLKILKK